MFFAVLFFGAVFSASNLGSNRLGSEYTSGINSRFYISTKLYGTFFLSYSLSDEYKAFKGDIIETESPLQKYSLMIYI